MSSFISIRRVLGISFVFLFALSGCGGASNQYSLDVQGSMTVGDTANLALAKQQGINDAEPQIVLGTTFVEVNQDFPNRIGVNFKDFNASATFPDIGEVRLTMTPQIAGDGILFKRDDQGNPLGDSILNLPLTIEIPGAEPPSQDLGVIVFQAPFNEPNKLPVLGQIPIVGFLFNNQNKSVQTKELLIILTPQVVDLLEE